MAGTAHRLLHDMDSKAKGYTALEIATRRLIECIEECSKGCIDIFYCEPFAAFIDAVLKDAVQYVNSRSHSSC